MGSLSLPRFVWFMVSQCLLLGGVGTLGYAVVTWIVNGNFTSEVPSSKPNLDAALFAFVYGTLVMSIFLVCVALPIQLLIYRLGARLYVALLAGAFSGLLVTVPLMALFWTQSLSLYSVLVFPFWFHFAFSLVGLLFAINYRRATRL